MRQSKKILIVEGETDQRFVREFIHIEELALAVDVKVATAPDVNSEIKYSSKQAVLQSIGYAIEDLNDGRYTHIGVLIDMDFQHDSKTAIKEQNIEQLSNILNDYGFELSKNDDSGLSFVNPEYDNPIGVWLMPNNQDEGYLETWIESCLQGCDNSIKEHFDKSKDFVQSYGDNHFKHHLNKANIYTWLATQKKPTQDLHKSLNSLNKQTPEYQNFKSWLVQTFADGNN